MLLCATNPIGNNVVGDCTFSAFLCSVAVFSSLARGIACIFSHEHESFAKEKRCIHVALHVASKCILELLRRENAITILNRCIKLINVKSQPNKLLRNSVNFVFNTLKGMTKMFESKEEEKVS